MPVLVVSLEQTGTIDLAMTKRIKLNTKKNKKGIIIERVEFELDPTIVVNWNETIDQWVATSLSYGWDELTTIRHLDDDRVICSWVICAKQASQVGFNYPIIQYKFEPAGFFPVAVAVDELQLCFDSVSTVTLNKVYYRISYSEEDMSDIDYLFDLARRL